METWEGLEGARSILDRAHRRLADLAPLIRRDPAVKAQYRRILDQSRLLHKAVRPGVSLEKWKEDSGPELARELYLILSETWVPFSPPPSRD